jgi:hypothetical protein
MNFQPGTFGGPKECLRECIRQQWLADALGAGRYHDRAVTALYLA